MEENLEYAIRKLAFYIDEETTKVSFNIEKNKKILYTIVVT